ncbi:hypothetical protein ISCGN_010598 [Ixodes scapularis]
MDEYGSRSGRRSGSRDTGKSPSAGGDLHEPTAGRGLRDHALSAAAGTTAATAETAEQNSLGPAIDPSVGVSLSPGAGEADTMRRSTTPSPQGRTASARPEKRRQSNSSNVNKRGDAPGEECRRSDGRREGRRYRGDRDDNKENPLNGEMPTQGGRGHDERQEKLRELVIQLARIIDALVPLLKEEMGQAAEYAATSVTVQGRPIVVVSSYVAPQVTGLRWDPQEVQEICRRIPTDSQGIISGDFNAHSESWGNGTTTQRGRALQAVLDDLDLVNITQGEPTYVGACSKDSVINLTLVTGGLRVAATPAPDSGGSDH